MHGLKIYKNICDPNQKYKQRTQEKYRYNH